MNLRGSLMALSSMLLVLAAFPAAAPAAGTQEFIFRYKVGLVSQAPDPDGVCQPGEQGLPDCDGHCDAGEEGSPDCVVAPPGDQVTDVSPVPDWDNVYEETDSAVPLQLTATDNKTVVAPNNVIYQCFKGTGGHGNYNWSVYYASPSTAGLDKWVEAMDIVLKSDLSTPLVNSTFNWYGDPVPVAPQFDAGTGKLRINTGGSEACLRVRVKPDSVPADEVLFGVWLDDYPSDVVQAGEVDPGMYQNSPSFAAVDVAMKPNCAQNCLAGLQEGQLVASSIDLLVSPNGTGAWNGSEIDYDVNIEPTTSTEALPNGLYYSCFSMSGPYGNYLWSLDTSLMEAGGGEELNPDAIKWIDGYDLVPKSQLSSPFQSAGTFGGDLLAPGFDFSQGKYRVTSEQEACLRLKVKDSSPMQAVRLPLFANDVPASQVNAGHVPVSGFTRDSNLGTETGTALWRFAYLFLTPNCLHGCAPIPQNNNNGLCEMGESGSDCDGTCEAREEGSQDCNWPGDGLTLSYVDQFAYNLTQFSSSVPADDPVRSSQPWITRQVGFTLAATYGGQQFSYQCFDATGPWGLWNYRVDLDIPGGGYDWLTDLDLVPQADLYSGTVAPLNGGISANYPTSLASVTASSRICVRWRAAQPQWYEQPRAHFEIVGTNYETNDVSTSYRVDEIHSGYIVPN